MKQALSLSEVSDVRRSVLPVALTRRIAPFFRVSRGLRRIDDRRVIGGIVHAIRDGSDGRTRRAATVRTRPSTLTRSAGQD